MHINLVIRNALNSDCRMVCKGVIFMKVHFVTSLPVMIVMMMVMNASSHRLVQSILHTIALFSSFARMPISIASLPRHINGFQKFHRHVVKPNPSTHLFAKMNAVFTQALLFIPSVITSPHAKFTRIYN